MKRQLAEIRVKQLVEEFLTQIGVSLDRQVNVYTTGEGTVSGKVRVKVIANIDISTFLVMAETDVGKQSHSGAA